MLINKRHGHSCRLPKESVDKISICLFRFRLQIIVDLSNGKSVELLHTIYRI